MKKKQTLGNDTGKVFFFLTCQNFSAVFTDDTKNSMFSLGSQGLFTNVGEVMLRQEELDPSLWTIHPLKHSASKN